ncbi:MAG: hypothetical protein WBV60_16855 [Terriglobales bacterium]
MPTTEAKPRKRKRKVPPLLKWLRSVGFLSLSFGWGSILFAGWFWPGVSFVYLGFAVVSLDLWFEPEVSLRWRIIGIVIALALMGAFSWGIVFVPGDLPVYALMTDGEYPSGTTIAGIAWKPQFTELNVDIKNPTDNAYEDISLVIRPTEAIAAIAQKSSLAGVTFEDSNGMAMFLLDKELGTGKSKAIPLVLIATDAGYRMRCSKLPAKSTIQVVIALTDIKWDPKPRLDILAAQLLADPNYMLKIKNDDFSAYWYGYKDGDVYATRPTSSEWLKVDGTYIVGHRKRTISQKVMIGGKVNVNPL